MLVIRLYSDALLRARFCACAYGNCFMACICRLSASHEFRRQLKVWFCQQPAASFGQMLISPSPLRQVQKILEIYAKLRSFRFFSLNYIPQRPLRSSSMSDCAKLILLLLLLLLLLPYLTSRLILIHNITLMLTLLLPLCTGCYCNAAWLAANSICCNVLFCISRSEIRDSTLYSDFLRFFCLLISLKIIGYGSSFPCAVLGGSKASRLFRLLDLILCAASLSLLLLLLLCNASVCCAHCFAFSPSWLFTCLRQIPGNRLKSPAPAPTHFICSLPRPLLGGCRRCRRSSLHKVSVGFLLFLLCFLFLLLLCCGFAIFGFESLLLSAAAFVFLVAYIGLCWFPLRYWPSRFAVIVGCAASIFFLCFRFSGLL